MGFSIENLKGTIGSSYGLAQGNLFLVKLPPNIAVPTSNGGIFDRIGDAFDNIVNKINTGLDDLAHSIGLNTGFQKPDDISILCKSTTMPGRRVDSLDRTIGIQKDRIAHGYVDDDVSMTFWVTNDMKVKDYFDAWQKMAVDTLNGDVNYFDTYARPITIYQLKKGAGIPISSGDLNLPKLPYSLQSRLPSIGPVNFANGTYNISIFTGNDIVQQTTLVNAWPNTVQAIQLGDDQNGFLELTVSFTFRRWYINTEERTASGSFLSAAVGSLVDKIF